MRMLPDWVALRVTVPLPVKVNVRLSFPSTAGPEATASNTGSPELAVAARRTGGRFRSASAGGLNVIVWALGTMFTVTWAGGAA